MKKLISLLLAVSVMSASSSVFAGSLGSSNSNRNPGNNDSDNGYHNTNFIRNYQSTQHNAVYRAGDVITFTSGDHFASKTDEQIANGQESLPVAAGDVITFISSKYDEDLSNSTVQFIDQVTATGTTFSYTYKLRDTLADGDYKIDIKVGDYDVYTFYYTVATPKIQIAAVDENGTQAYIRKGYAYYFGSASIGTGSAGFYQAGAQDFGFDFNGNEYTFDAKTFDNARANNEVGGTGNWWFSIAVDLEGEDVAPTAKATLIGEKNIYSSSTGLEEVR